MNYAWIFPAFPQKRENRAMIHSHDVYPVY